MTRVMELPEIQVFTQAHCAGCREVDQFFRERGVTFTVRDVAADPSALEEITSRGYMSTPITRIGERWVAGYKPTELENLLRAFQDDR